LAPPRRSADNRSTDDYRHDEATRKNNPPAGMVSYEAALREQPQAQYAYDPHLSPQLVWAGKPGLRQIEVEDAAGVSVDTVSLHIHERVSTQAIIAAVQKPQPVQLDLFADPQLPLGEAVEFYQHDVDWANRLVLGDSLLVMNSLVQRELMAGKVQMIYIDPPYGVKFASNFQPRIDQRGVKEKDDDLTREPEQIKAYRDTWTLGVHSYLTYLRDRLRIARELLTDSGSIFVQISDENVHLVRCLMDEVFGADNFVSMISYKTSVGLSAALLDSVHDYLIWYARDRSLIKYRQLFRELIIGEEGATRYTKSDPLFPDHLYTDQGLTSRSPSESTLFPVEFEGNSYRPTAGGWRTGQEGMGKVLAAERVLAAGKTIRFKKYFNDFGALALTNMWEDVGGGIQSRLDPKVYVVQTTNKVIERCLLMTTDPGDLVLDPTCGSGTTAYVAEQWGRRWITCDTSRVAVSLARQRLLTATFPFYTLAYADRGVDGGFNYKTVPHITLRSIAQNTRLDPIVARYQPLLDEALGHLNQAAGQSWQPWEVPFEAKKGWSEEASKLHERYLDLCRRKQQEIDRIIAEDAPQETLFDQPQIDRSIVRVSGPFTVEAIPPAVEEFMQAESPIAGAPESVDDGRQTMDDSGPPSSADHRPSSEGSHIPLLIDLMRQDGVTFPDNRRLQFASLTPLSGGALHAEGLTPGSDDGPDQRVAISFGPQHGQVSARQVEDALWEASRGGYDLLVFAGFAFDAAAMSAIATGHPRLKVFFSHIRPDVLLTDAEGDSLLKTTASAQLFTVFGEPDVALRQRDDGDFEVELRGVDVYDPLTGAVHSARASQVAAWFLDTDYDRRAFRICQAFFPNKSAWQKLERALRGTLNEDLFDLLTGRVSLPFQPGEHRRIAVKVIDQRGNEVMRVVPL